MKQRGKNRETERNAGEITVNSRERTGKRLGKNGETKVKWRKMAM